MKIRMRWFAIVILLALINACTENSLNVSYNRTPDSILAKDIKRKLFWKLKQEKKLYPIEYGWSFEGKKQIQMFHCGFFYYNEIDMETARELVITVGNELLKEINAHEELRSYLGPFPFKPENLLITIFLFNPDGSEPLLENLQLVSLREGIVNYKIRALDTKRLTTICKETYEEATAKLNESALETPS